MGTPRPAMAQGDDADGSPAPFSAVSPVERVIDKPAETLAHQPQSKSWLKKTYVAIEEISLTPFQRISYTRTAVVLGFLAGFLLSSKLWISARYFPLIPVVHRLPALRYPLDYLCAAALFLLLSSIGFASRPRPYIAAFATLLLFLGLYDQNRWQPWVYSVSVYAAGTGLLLG